MCTYGSGGEPEPRAAVVVLARGPARAPWRPAGASAATARRPTPGARAAARRSRTAASPAAGRGRRGGSASPRGTPSSSAASAGAAVRMSETATSGANDAHELARRPRRAHRRLVGLQRLLARGEDLVLGRGGERHPRGLGRLAPALPRLDPHLVAAREQLAARARASGTRGPGPRTRRAGPSNQVSRVPDHLEPDPRVPLRAAVAPPPARAVEVLGGRAFGVHSCSRTYPRTTISASARSSIAPAIPSRQRDGCTKTSPTCATSTAPVRRAGTRRWRPAVRGSNAPFDLASRLEVPFSAQPGGATGTAQPGGAHSR